MVCGLVICLGGVGSCCGVVYVFVCLRLICWLLCLLFGTVFGLRFGFVFLFGGFGV